MSGSNSSGLSRRVGTVPKSLRSKSAHASAALSGVTLSSRFKLRSIWVRRASISRAGASCWVEDVTLLIYPRSQLRLAGDLGWDADRQGTWLDFGVKGGGLADDIAVELVVVLPVDLDPHSFSGALVDLVILLGASGDEP